MNQKETATPSSSSQKQPHRKQVRNEIAEKLTGALSEYKQDLGEKKLATHVKMVSKLISRDLEKAGKNGKKLKEQKTKESQEKKKASKKSPKKTQEKSEVK